MQSFALRSYALSEEKQMLSLGEELSKTGTSPTPFNPDTFWVPTITGKQLKMSQYPNYVFFESAVFKTLDNYFSHQTQIPQFFVTAYNQANTNTHSNIDTLLRAIKNYYKSNNLGPLFTVVLNSKPHHYINADFVHIPSHLMNSSNFISPNLYQNNIITEGIVHDVTQDKILCAYLSNTELQKELSAIKSSHPTAPNAVFCLGGITKGSEIKFDMSVAEDIVLNAKKLNKKGYDVFIINGPRTPSDLTDYFYERMEFEGTFNFYNSKQIAHTPDEALIWQNYSGKYCSEFSESANRLGNVYPALLALPNTMAIHTYDSFASCETSSIGIPTSIYTGVLKIDETKRPDCHKLAQIMCDKGYAINAKTFIDNDILPNDWNLKPLPEVTSQVARQVYQGYQDYIMRGRVAREVLGRINTK